MNIKQFKKKWLMSKIEPELFYMPVGKEEIKFGSLYIRVKSYQQYNIDANLFEGEVSNINCEIVIKDYNGNIVYTNKRGKGEFFPSIPTFHTLPYGKYYVKVIRVEGYELDNQFYEVELNSNYAFLDIILDWQICINTITNTINSSPYYGYTDIVGRKTYPNVKFLKENPIASTYSDNCITTNLHGDLIAEINNYTDYAKCGYNICQTFSQYNNTYLTVSFIGTRFNHLQISPTTYTAICNYQIIDKGFFIGVNKITPRPSTGIMLNHISSVADIYQGYEYSSTAQFSYVYEMTVDTTKYYVVAPVQYNVYNNILNGLAIVRTNSEFYDYDKDNIDKNWFSAGNRLIAEGLQEEIIDNIKYTYYCSSYSSLVDSFLEDDNYNIIKLMPNIEYINNNFIDGLAESYKIHNSSLSSTLYLYKRRNYILNGNNLSNTSVVTQENQYLVFANAIIYSDDYDEY